MHGVVTATRNEADVDRLWHVMPSRIVMTGSDLTTSCDLTRDDLTTSCAAIWARMICGGDEP